jgi:hypothetical protein
MEITTHIPPCRKEKSEEESPGSDKYFTFTLKVILLILAAIIFNIPASEAQIKPFRVHVSIETGTAFMPEFPNRCVRAEYEKIMNNGGRKRCRSLSEEAGNANKKLVEFVKGKLNPKFDELSAYKEETESIVAGFAMLGKRPDESLIRKREKFLNALKNQWLELYYKYLNLRRDYEAKQKKSDKCWSDVLKEARQNCRTVERKTSRDFTVEDLSLRGVKGCPQCRDLIMKARKAGEKYDEAKNGWNVEYVEKIYIPQLEWNIRFVQRQIFILSGDLLDQPGKADILTIKEHKKDLKQMKRKLSQAREALQRIKKARGEMEKAEGAAYICIRLHCKDTQTAEEGGGGAESSGEGGGLKKSGGGKPEATDKKGKIPKKVATAVVDLFPSDAAIADVIKRLNNSNSLSEEVLETVSYDITARLVSMLTGLDLPFRSTPEQLVRKIAVLAVIKWASDELTLEEIMKFNDLYSQLTPELRKVFIRQFIETYQQLLFRTMLKIMGLASPGLQPAIELIQVIPLTGNNPFSPDNPLNTGEDTVKEPGGGKVPGTPGEGGGGKPPVKKEPDIYVTPAKVDFGAVEVGKKASRTVTIQNRGNADLIVFVTGPVPPFSLDTDGCSNRRIPPGGSCSIVIGFSPQSDLFEMTTDVSISSNDPDSSTVRIPVSGSGFKKQANDFIGMKGSYSGDGGCGIGSTVLDASGQKVTLAPLGDNGPQDFKVDATGRFAISVLSSLVIFGQPGHSCNISIIGGNIFGLSCFHGSNSCFEQFSR